MLDSWVRFESSQRENEQRQLAQTVISKVMDHLNDPKSQKAILDNAVQEVERLVKEKAL